jgi:predicted enzyme related to lactoylglutathione lyase
VVGFQPVSVAAAPRTRLRLDIEVEELTETTARIAALGATLIDVVHFRPGEEHRVFTDPEGNEFNLVLPFPADPPSYEVTGASPATDGTV